MKEFRYLLMVNDGYTTEEYFFNDYDEMLEFLDDFTDVEYKSYYLDLDMEGTK